MRCFWGILFLVACSPEYSIKNKNNVVEPVVDSAVETIVSVPPTTTTETTDTAVEPVPLIEVTPYDYDFGEVPIGCTEEYEVVISSVGTAPLVIDEFIYINSPDLSMSHNFTLPLVLQPGESTSVLFEYTEDDLFEDVGKLYIYSNALGKSEQRVDHYGYGIALGPQIDVYEHEQINKADILFVIDNSCSMTEEQAELSENVEEFVDTLVSNSTDFKIAVITTDSDDPVGPVISSDTIDPAKDLSDIVQVGTGGDAFEMGQHMAMKALDLGGSLSKGFMREDASMSVIVVSDENDYSPLADLDYHDFFMTLKEPDLFFFHSVVGFGPIPGCTTERGERYINQSSYSFGLSLDICASWGSGLTTIASPTYVIQEAFPLSKQALASSIEVYTGGELLIDGWHYDEATNTVYITDKSKIKGEELLQITYDYTGDCE